MKVLQLAAIAMAAARPGFSLASGASSIAKLAVSRVLDDPMAKAIASDIAVRKRFSQIKNMRGRLGREEAEVDREEEGSRALWIRESAAATGRSQYVVLPSGYDTFSHDARFIEKGAKAYEIDDAKTLAFKRHLIDTKGREVPRAASVTYVPADLNVEWDAELFMAGFSKMNSTTWVVPGLGLEAFHPHAALRILRAPVNFGRRGDAVVFRIRDASPGRFGVNTPKIWMTALGYSRAEITSFDIRGDRECGVIGYV